MRTILALCLLLLAPVAQANDWDALRLPGAHAIMRHALAPGTGDPPGFDVGDCATQRNLDDRGREQARRIGAELRARGIGFETVLTSQWCRCRETAELLAIGPVTDEPALNSFFQDRASGPAQTEATRRILAEADTPLFLVTHQVNITALTGVFPASGEIVVFREGADGIEVLGTIELDP